MEAFISQSEAEKSRQLQEMTFIVIGMRLFQFSSGGKDVPGVSDHIGDARSILNGTLGEALHLDNVVSSWGTGQDLQIKHDPSGGGNSYIQDLGAGELRVDSNTLRIRNASGSATQALFNEGSFEQ